MDITVRYHLLHQGTDSMLSFKARAIPFLRTSSFAHRWVQSTKLSDGARYIRMLDGYPVDCWP